MLEKYPTRSHEGAKEGFFIKGSTRSGKGIFSNSFSFVTGLLAAWLRAGFFLLFLGFSPGLAQGLNFKPLSLIPIQDGGRVKPLDTFARESVHLITGREKFQGRESMDVLMDWLVHPNDWNTKNIILVENLDFRKFLQLPEAQSYTDPNRLRENDGFIAYAKTCYAKQQKKIALNPMEKEALAVFNRLQRYYDIESGDALTLIPISDPKTLKWASLGDLQRAYRVNPSGMPLAAKAVLASFAELAKGYDKRQPAEFLAQSQSLAGLLSQIGGATYAKPSKMSLEVLYNALKPFRWAWIIHLTAFLLIGLSFLLNSPRLFKPGFFVFIAGILMSAYGFVLRCLIAGRPPVSNMYESLIWVIFGMTVFALLFELAFKNRYFALSGSILAVIGFVLADNVPTILDPSIQPIEPVLRSNFWLTIHVLTITLSYAAFLLSLGIGHVCLWSLFRHRQDKDRLQRQTKLLYRVVQVGVVLLAAGTILGGVWANYSWGRFWGWDPKETWALIALLGYVAVLHGRLAGWLREVGFVIGVVSAFLGVLMAWYGVNFILGVGLHSYGFSKGGLPYVIAFVAFEIILVTVVGLKARTKTSPAPRPVSHP